jgi:hypothetical protein
MMARAGKLPSLTMFLKVNNHAAAGKKEGVKGSAFCTPAFPLL